MIFFYLYFYMGIALGSAPANTIESILTFKYETFCHEAKSIMPDDCTKNGIFVEAGSLCLEKVRRESKKIQKYLEEDQKLYMDKLKKQNLSEQDVYFQTTERAYRNSKLAADYMLSVIKMARDQVYNYEEELHPPEDYDSPTITRGNPEWFLMVDNPCYGNRKLDLDKILAELDKEKANVEAQKNLSQVKGNKSAGNSSDLENISKIQPKTTYGQGGVSPKVVEKKGLGKSDVSGTTESAEKEKKAKTIIQKK